MIPIIGCVRVGKSKVKYIRSFLVVIDYFHI